MTDLHEEGNAILDDLFHGSAWTAFVELITTNGELPDSEATKALAYDIYEDALAGRSATRPTQQPHADALTPH